MKRAKRYKQGQGYTKADWDAVDSPELTKDQMAQARRFADVFPDLARSIKKGRGPGKKPTKRLVSLRLSPDVLDHFKAKGPGWQTKIDETLRKAAKLQRRAS
jgi:uncharacterized protein (DUF4415 family)